MAVAAHAQGSRRVELSPAERAIAAGQLDVAQDLLFENTRVAPREPTARGALGQFLASRGRFLVGATLLEEALLFGGDTVSIESRLLEIFRWTAQYDRAGTLAAARMVPEERSAMRRAGAAAAGGAATATVPLQPNEAFGLGRFALRVGSESVDADIQPLMSGLELPSTQALFSVLEPVGSRGDTTYGVVRQISIGGVRFGPVPVKLVPSLRTARIGLDLLSQLTPTIDAGRAELVVRSEAKEIPGKALPVLLSFPGLTFVAREGDAPVSLHTVSGRSVLRGLRWTLDMSAGAIIIEP
jgi:hypothetical protein